MCKKNYRIVDNSGNGRIGSSNGGKGSGSSCVKMSEVPCLARSRHGSGDGNATGRGDAV